MRLSQSLYEETRAAVLLRVMGRCYERLDRHDEAKRAFEAYLATPALPQDKAEEARRLVEAMETRIRVRQASEARSRELTAPVARAPEVSAAAPPAAHAPRSESSDGAGWLLTFGMGVGGGWTNGRPEVNRGDNRGVSVEFSGLARAAAFHLAPEVGRITAGGLMIALQPRLQFVMGATEVVGAACAADGEVGVCEPAGGAPALLAKLGTVRRLSGGRAWIPAAVLGLGQIRHLVRLGDGFTDCGPDQESECVDTIASGPVLVGADVRYWWPIGRTFGLSAQATLLGAVPKTAIQLDLALGFGLRL